MLHASAIVGPLVAAQLALAPPAPLPLGALANETPTSVTDEALAAQAPEPAWVDEGGAAAHAGGDPREQRRAIRRAARTTIAGGAVALIGFAGCMSVTPLYVLPRRTLTKLREENDGNLPPGDPKRQRAIVASEAAPFVLGASAGLVLAGTLVAFFAGRRFKRLREEKRTSTVAFAPGPAGLGFGVGLGAQVRF
jgi:hypothetical protein